MLNSISSSDYPNRQLNGVSFFSLHELRKSNIFRVIIGHINMNSVRNKFELLKEIIKDNIDIFTDGYSTPYRLDRISHVAGILLYI